MFEISTINDYRGVFIGEDIRVGRGKLGIRESWVYVVLEALYNLLLLALPHSMAEWKAHSPGYNRMP